MRGHQKDHGKLMKNLCMDFKNFCVKINIFKFSFPWTCWSALVHMILCEYSKQWAPATGIIGTTNWS